MKYEENLKCYTVFSPVNTYIGMWYSRHIPFPAIHSYAEQMHTHVLQKICHRGIILNSFKLETMQKVINSWLDKLWYIHTKAYYLIIRINGIQLDVIIQVTYRHNVKQQKMNTKDYTLCDWIQNIKIKKLNYAIWNTLGCGGGALYL